MACAPRRPKWHYCWNFLSRHNRNSNSLRNRIWREQVAGVAREAETTPAKAVTVNHHPGRFAAT
jgi:hypothetical protein